MNNNEVTFFNKDPIYYSLFKQDFNFNSNDEELEEKLERIKKFEESMSSIVGDDLQITYQVLRDNYDSIRTNKLIADITHIRQNFFISFVFLFQAVLFFSLYFRG